MTNTLSGKTYVTENIYWGAIAMLWYRIVCFRSIGYMNSSLCKGFLWLMVIVFMAAGIWLTYKNYRNYYSLLINILVPFEVYTLISYAYYLAGWVIVTLAATAIGVGWYCWQVLWKKKCKLKMALVGTRTIFAVCAAGVLIWIGGSTALGYGLVQANVQEKEQEYTIDKCMTTIHQLDKTIWPTLSLQHKIDVLQEIAYIEKDYLGIPHELIVQAGNLSEYVVGQYDERTHTITVNIDYLADSSGYKMLNNLCHEAHHAYQRSLVDVYDQVDDELKTLLIMREAAEYKENFSNYEGGSDYEAYYYQACEMASRDYASWAAQRYWDRVLEYTENVD